MAYTVRDTPAIVRRIEHDLDTLVEAVRAADPKLQALVLTGGFARGEGAVRHGQPQNDYDLVALRRVGSGRGAYPTLRKDLEEQLGLHIDLAPVESMRLPWTPRSIFWYETALRGRTLWGDPDLLKRIPVRRPLQIDRKEPMRLLANRSAGLVLATEQDDDGHRLQASKALLGAMDAWLLAEGVFPPSQKERWHAFQRLLANDAVPRRLAAASPWLAWAFAYKTRPERAPHRSGQAAWQAAGRSVLDAIPEALAHANLPSLEAYARQDAWLDAVLFLRRARTIPGARPMRHPTSNVRVATIRMLEACLDGSEPAACLEPVVGANGSQAPLATLQALRAATLQ